MRGVGNHHHNAGANVALIPEVEKINRSVYIRYRLRIFQQLPHQTLGQLNGYKHFLTSKGLWQINARLWIWLWRWQNSDFQSQFSMSKIIWILPFFFFIEEYKIRSTTYIYDTFWLLVFWSTLFTKIGPNFQTLIQNQLLICQRPIQLRKCLLPFD